MIAPRKTPSLTTGTHSASSRPRSVISWRTNGSSESLVTRWNVMFSTKARVTGESLPKRPGARPSGRLDMPTVASCWLFSSHSITAAAVAADHAGHRGRQGLRHRGHGLGDTERAGQVEQPLGGVAPLADVVERGCGVERDRGLLGIGGQEALLLGEEAVPRAQRDEPAVAASRRHHVGAQDRRSERAAVGAQHLRGEAGRLLSGHALVAQHRHPAVAEEREQELRRVHRVGGAAGDAPEHRVDVGG